MPSPHFQPTLIMAVRWYVINLTFHFSGFSKLFIMLIKLTSYLRPFKPLVVGITVGLFIITPPPPLHSQPPSPKAKSNPLMEDQRKTAQLSQQARQAEKMEDWEKALQLWLSIWAQKPGDWSAYSGIKRCYTQLGRYDDALAFLNRAPTDQRSAPSRIEPSIIAGDKVEILLHAGRGEEAKRVIEESLKQSPTDLNLYRSLASALFRMRLTEEAKAILLKGRQMLSNPHLFASELAFQAEQRMDWAEATREHINWLREDPNRLPSVVNIISDYIINPGADSIVSQILTQEQKAASPEGRLLLERLQGGIWMRQGLYRQALALYLEIAQKGSGEDIPNLLEISRQLESEGETPMALQGYRAAFHLSHIPSQRAEIALRLGKLFRSFISKPAEEEKYSPLDSARFYLQEATNPAAPPDVTIQARLELGSIQEHLKEPPEEIRNTYQEALKTARRIKASPSLTEELHLRIAQTFYQEDNLTGAEEVLKSGVKSLGSQGSPASLLRWRLAKLYWHRGSLTLARQTAQALLNANPRSTPANEALTLLALLESLAEDSAGCARLGRIDYLLDQGKVNYALTELEDLAASSHPRVREEALWLKVAAYRQAGRPQEALQTLETLSQPLSATLRPDKALWEAGLIALEQLTDTARAVEYWDRLLQEYPLSPFAPQVRSRLQPLLTPNL